MTEQNEKKHKIDVVSLHGKNTDIHFFYNEGKVQIQIDKTFLNGKKPKVVELMTIEKDAWTELNMMMVKLLLPPKEVN